MANERASSAPPGGAMTPPGALLVETLAGAGIDAPGLLAIADCLPVMIAYVDPGLRYQFCNRPVADWFETSRRAMIGQSLEQVMGAQAFAQRRSALEAALRGERQHLVADFHHPTRGPLTTQADYIPHLDASGAVVGLILIIQDVTEQRAAERALRESELRFRRIADSAPAPMWVTRADGSRDFVNQAYLDFFGFPPEEVGQHDWRRAMHPDDAGRVAEDYARGVQSGLPFELEGRFRRADGSWRWLRATSRPRLDAQKRVVGFIGVAADVTIAKQAEAALTRQVAEGAAELDARELQFRAIFDTARGHVLLLDTDGNVLQSNRAGAWRDADAGGDLGLPLWDAPSMRDFPVTMLRTMVAAARGGATMSQQVELVRPGAPFFALDCAIRPVEREGELRYLLLEVWDVTELKLAQDQLRQSQKMEALGQLTGGIAHDFNNLLTVVVGGLDLISRRADDPAILRYASNALAAAERGARLTGQLLSFSRVQKLEVRAVSVPALIDDVVPLLRNVLGPGIEMTVDVDPAVDWLLADPTQVEVAMLNLAINARDAMPGGGTLSVRAERVQIDHDPELSPGAYVRLAIADTGEGIPAHLMERVFEPFFTTKETGKGTGLGLSMVYGMARQSLGTARIESVPGEGTTVVMLFRAAEAPSGERIVGDTSARASDGPGRTGRILVVDDDPEVRDHLVSTLGELGHQVTAAADAEEGLAQYRIATPDLVVLDYIMPRVSGAELAHAIRAIRPDQPILFVSGYSETEAIRAAVGDAPLLSKPFRADVLAETVRDLLAAIA